jgi:hypothetical protein
VMVWCNGSAFKTIGRSVAAATQAQVRTGTATTVYIPPARARDHASAAKAWALFVGTATGTSSPTAASNIGTIVRDGTGTYSLFFTTPMTGTGYVVMPHADNSQFTTVVVRGTSSFAFRVNNSVGNPSDGTNVQVVVYGTA